MQCFWGKFCIPRNGFFPLINPDMNCGGEFNSGIHRMGKVPSDKPTGKSRLHARLPKPE